MNNQNSDLFQFPQVYMVEASAGSGKTYALAARYIRLLLNPHLQPGEIPLNKVLAITFTNKAALEMKERIIDLLKKIALDKFVNTLEASELIAGLSITKDEARLKATRILNELIRNYNFFQVQTIDSFINAILSGCAFRLDLSAGFKTEINYQDYLSYSLDALIDKAETDEDARGLFIGFLHQYLYVENKTGWFPKQSILSVLISLFTESNKYPGSFVSNPVEAKDLIGLKINILELINCLNDNMPEGVNGNFLRSISGFLAANKSGFNIEALSDFFKREELPINKGKVCPPEARELWGAIRKHIRQLCELESASLCNYYIYIFNRVFCGLKALSSKDDVLFLEALNKEAAGLFDEKSLGLPELYYRLACRFKHFLLDEFQDTSSLQWKNLLPMVEEALSTAGSLFYVGDKKQAIYRFRGGQVELIEGVKKYFSGFSLVCESLPLNYRSLRQIVEFNNLIFSEDNLRSFFIRRQQAQKSAAEFTSLEIEEIIKVFSGSNQKYRPDKPGGYVKSGFIEARTREERGVILKDKIIRLVDDLRSRLSLGDIAFLVRKNEEAQVLTAWLLDAGIPVESEKTLNVRNNSYIKEIVSFLQFLNSPIDNLAFSSFILGDIFLTAGGISRQEIEDFIFGLRDKESVYLYREFRLRFPEIWDRFIEDFFKNIGFVPLYELTVSIFRKFNVSVNFYGYQGFFMKFLELVKDHEEEGSSVSSFLEFFDKADEQDLYVNVTEGNAVKILTIHKSKGLEFPVVVIPFLEMNIKVDPMFVVPSGNEIKLMYIKKKYCEYSSFLADLWNKEYVKACIDELNNIYVAFTRPQRELYIFSCGRAERGFNPASVLLPENNLELGSRAIEPAEQKPKVSQVVEIPASDYKEWIPLIQDEFAGAGVSPEPESIRKGEVAHFILSCLGNLYDKDKGLAVKEAIAKAAARFSNINDFSGFEAVVSGLINDSRFVCYFEIQEGAVFQEKEIIDPFGNTKRIDRLIITPQKATVIDFKSAKSKEEDHRRQLLEYMRDIGDIYRGLTVKGVLIYLDDLSFEEINS